MNYLGFIQDFCEMHNMSIEAAMRSNLVRSRMGCKCIYEFLLDKGVDHALILKLMRISNSQYNSFMVLESERNYLQEYYSDKAMLKHEILYLSHLSKYAGEYFIDNINADDWEDLLKHKNNVNNRLDLARKKLQNLRNNLPALGLPEYLTPLKINYAGIKD